MNNTKKNHMLYVHTNLKVLYAFLFGLSMLISSCDNDDSNQSDDNIQTPDWTDESHGKDATLNYQLIFPQEQVNTLEITMTKEDWENIKEDMEEKFGSEFGEGGGFGSPVGGAPPDGGPGGIPGGVPAGGISFGTGEPDYVAVALKFNDREWYKVGFRLKGNSTLASSWRNGKYKLPFRLNFDYFEDEYPAIADQRFYGFKELSMSPGANDNSLIREKVTADIFRSAGIPAAQTAFYAVYINFGDGKKYCGVYTMVEVIDDTMIKTQFGEDDGNIYKPESTLASFDEDVFEKKNNSTENDFSDVQNLVAYLNESTRTSDPQLWRTHLESALNVDHFLNWLAVNTAIVNWDSYGVMAHNYYLYNHSQAKLTWIPWDHNEAMRGQQNAPQLSLANVSSSWPLIRNLADDEKYYAVYKSHLQAFLNNGFNSTTINAMFDKYHDLISPYVIGPQGTESGDYSLLTSTSSFNSSVSELKSHIGSRISAVQEFLK